MHAWLTGAGAYEGLMANVVLEDHLSVIRGFITPGGPPPVPEVLPDA